MVQVLGITYSDLIEVINGVWTQQAVVIIVASLAFLYSRHRKFGWEWTRNSERVRFVLAIIMLMAANALLRGWFWMARATGNLDMFGHWFVIIPCILAVWGSVCFMRAIMPKYGGATALAATLIALAVAMWVNAYV